MHWYAERLNPNRCWGCAQPREAHKPNGRQRRDLGCCHVDSERIDNTLSCPPKQAGNGLLIGAEEEAAA